MRRAEPFKKLDPGILRDGELSVVLRRLSPGMADRGWVPTYVFEMVHDRDGIVGAIDLRVGHLERLRLYAGHIGYTVWKPFRGQRYAARSVKLLLPFAFRSGLNPLWITCDPENLASKRTCELAGGELMEIIEVSKFDPLYDEGHRFKCRYRFLSED